jgi:hypothetical protein
MKYAIAIIAILGSVPAMAGMTTVEFATGIGSPYWVADANWRCSVGSDGLFFKEYAARVEYSFSRNWGISTAAGWIHDKDFSSRTITDYYWGETPTRKFYYLLPALSINTDELRAKIGTIIYRDDDEFGDDDFPFNSRHKFWPSFGVELGTPEFYLLGGFISSLPLYNESLEIGFGRRFSELYDQRIYLFTGLFESAGLGYRGEFKIIEKTALILGVSVGGNDNHREFYTFTLGIKSIIGHNALPNPDL